MSDNDVAGGRVVAVLLADGWHRIVPGSFRVGPLSFGAEADSGTPGFRFEEADAAVRISPPCWPAGRHHRGPAGHPGGATHRRPGPDPGPRTTVSGRIKAHDC